MHTCDCGFSCTSKYSLNRHLLSRHHEQNLNFNELIVPSQVSGLFECGLCDFSSLHKGNFKQHILSAKHRSAKERLNSSAVLQNGVISSPLLATAEVIKPVMLMEVMEMCLNHMKHETDSQKIQQTELFKTFADRIVAHQQHQQQQQQPSQQITVQSAETMTNTMTNTNNNQKFNLNVFLNEDCKNAMNMTDFIQSVVITMEDLEHLGEVGYTEGMSKILTKAIRSKETTERPMHCTDVKRETIYVRKDDVWKKDEDCEETKRLIQHISHKNYKALSEWREQHPEHTESDTADYEAWYSISRNMCNTDPSALKKLIRHLALTTAVEKNQLVSPP